MFPKNKKKTKVKTSKNKINDEWLCTDHKMLNVFFFLGISPVKHFEVLLQL